MYTSRQLSEDVSKLTNLNTSAQKRLDSLKNFINEKKVNRQFIWDLDNLGFDLEDYKYILKNMNIQDIYKTEITEYIKELIKVYKENDSKNFNIAEEYEGLSPSIKRYLDVYRIIEGILMTFDFFVPLDETDIDFYFELISNEIIKKNIALPPLDEDYAYVDKMIPFLININNYKLQNYLKDVDEKIDEIEKQKNQGNDGYFVENGFESFDIPTTTPQDDYEDLEYVLKKMKKENGNF